MSIYVLTFPERVMGCGLSTTTGIPQVTPDDQPEDESDHPWSSSSDISLGDGWALGQFYGHLKKQDADVGSNVKTKSQSAVKEEARVRVIDKKNSRRAIASALHRPQQHTLTRLSSCSTQRSAAAPPSQ